MTRVFRDVLKYVHKNNEYSEGSLLNRSITKQQQQQQLTLLRNRYSQFDIYNFNSTYPKMLRLF